MHSGVPQRRKNIEQFVPLHKQGCVGFKAFTVYAGSNYPFSDEYSQLKEMEKVASFHGIFGAHAEDRTLVNGFSNEHKEEPWSLAVHDASRPLDCGADRNQYLTALCRKRQDASCISATCPFRKVLSESPLRAEWA